MLAEETGLFGGLRLWSLLNAAEVGTRGRVVGLCVLEMVLPSLQQAVIHSSPPLEAHASLQLFVKPLVVYLVTGSLTS